MSFLQNFTQNFLPFLVSIAFLILIHELGHYIAAKLMKIEIEEFGIGFPPRAVKLFKIQETLFTLNWIPLGGFVKPKGENDHSIENGLAAAHPLKRIFVLISGPAANFLLGAILFGYIFLQLGQPISNKILVTEIAPNSPALVAQLQPDDQITKINGKSLQSIPEMIQAIQDAGETPISFTFLRDDKLHTVEIVPHISEEDAPPTIGVYITNPLIEVTNWGTALKLGAKDVLALVKSILTFPGRLIGYKSMYQIYTVVSENQYSTFNFFASISVSLAVINLLPIPALDGGRILFALPELFFKKRISQNIENAINLFSFLLLISTMIYVNVLDFINPITLP